MCNTPIVPNNGNLVLFCLKILANPLEKKVAEQKAV
jgi:hypothetical protein